MINRIRGRSFDGVQVGPTPTVRVWPTPGNAHIVHPLGGPLKEGNKGTPWPYDGFTRRRIVDGEITKTDPKDGKEG